MVHPGGRPRTRTPPPEELIKLGEDLLKWATEPTKELRCRFCQWYSLRHGILDREWDLMIEKEEFHGYYEKARVALGNRYLDGTVKEGIAHRFLRIYAPEVRKQENDDKVFESSLKEKENKAATEEDIKRHEALMAQISSLQNSRKIADNNNNPDT